MTYKYKVALSFAGEDREFARGVAAGLRDAGIEVFYDEFFTEELWGEELSVKFREIFSTESEYCLMILSEDYIEKIWPHFERQHILDRLVEQRGKAYLLPVRLDGFRGEVPGLAATIHYLSVRSDQPDVVANAFLKKIRKEPSAASAINREKVRKKPLIPKLKKGSTEKEKNEFLKYSLQEIASGIDQSLKETCKAYPTVEYEKEDLTARKILFTVYNSGNQIVQAKIWLKTDYGDSTICFSCGRHVEVDNDSSMNEIISTEECEGELKLKPIGMLMLGSSRSELFSPHQLTEYLWKAICSHIE